MAIGEGTDSAGRAGTLMLTDMSVCEPGSALTRGRKRHHWQLMDYQAEGMSGTLIGATFDTGAPAVTLALKAEGWHKVSIGFWSPPWGGDPDSRFLLRLTGDPAFTGIAHNQPFEWTRTDLKEAFWKCADLTGQDLIIAQQNEGRTQKAYVAYVKLEPMTQAEVAALAEDRADTSTRKVVGSIDGGFPGSKGCLTAEELWAHVEQFRHSDVGRIDYAVNYGTTTNYLSKVGVLCAGDGEVFDTPHGQRLYKYQRGLVDKGLVPFAEVMEHVHAMGLEFHAQFRMGLGVGSIEGEGMDCFGLKHPELRILAKDGTPLPKLSYAFPECRQWLLDLMKEVAQYDIDGVNLCFVRGPLFVGYEKPVVESFMEAHGDDPRTLDANDGRWLKHKAGYLTELVRQVKRLADEIGRKRGRTLAVAGWVDWAEELNMFHGYDVRTWINEGLVDSIMGMRDGELVKLAQTSGCKVFGGTGAREPENYIKNGLAGLDRDVDGFMIWDIDGVCELPEHWEILRNMGHRDRLEAFAKQLPKMKRTRILNVEGYDFARTYGKGAPDNWPPEMMIMYTNG